MKLKESVVSGSECKYLRLTYEIEDDDRDIIKSLDAGIYASVRLNDIFIIGKIAASINNSDVLEISIELCSDVHAHLLEIALKRNILELETYCNNAAGIIYFNLKYGDKFNIVCKKAVVWDFPMDIGDLITACGGLFSPCILAKHSSYGYCIFLEIPGSMRNSLGCPDPVYYKLWLNEAGWHAESREYSLFYCTKEFSTDVSYGSLFEAILLMNDILKVDLVKKETRESIEKYLYSNLKHADIKL